MAKLLSVAPNTYRFYEMNTAYLRTPPEAVVRLAELCVCTITGNTETPQWINELFS